jgi:hypothetical protein
MLPPFIALSIILATIIRLTNADANPGLAWIWPPPVGLDLTTASVAPCGGFNTSHDPLTYFLDQLRWNQTAEQITYMTRISQNLNASGPPSEWSQLYPTIQADVSDTEKNSASAPAQFCVPIPDQSTLFQNTSVFQLIANTPAGIIFAVSDLNSLILIR